MKRRAPRCRKVEPVPSPSRPNIVVVGPGAVGCLFAALLKEAGHNVTLLDHRPGRARIISRKGVTVQTARSSRRIKVAATASPSVAGIADVLFICAKSNDTGAAISRAACLVAPWTVVVSLQNGLDNVCAVAKIVPTDRIVCGITGHGVISTGPGRIRLAGGGRTRIAPVEPASFGIAQRIAGLLRDAGFDATATRDLAGMLWSKLVVNAAINPLTAILNVRNGDLLMDPVSRCVMLWTADEAAEVARAAGATLAFRDPRREVENVCRATAKNISSMLQDVVRGRKTEVESINGAIVREARRRGVPVPINRMLLKQIREVVKNA